jgi:hypothetical protein
VAVSAVFGVEDEAEAKTVEKRGIFGGYGYGGYGHGHYGGHGYPRYSSYHGGYDGHGHGHAFVAPYVSHSYSSVGHVHYPTVYSSGHHDIYDHHHDYLH